jgi:hypothetical protein
MCTFLFTEQYFIALLIIQFVLLWVDINVLKEHVASIFRVKMCKLMNLQGYKGSVGVPVTKGVVRMSSKMVLLRGTLVFHHRCEMQWV